MVLSTYSVFRGDNTGDTKQYIKCFGVAMLAVLKKYLVSWMTILAILNSTQYFGGSDTGDTEAIHSTDILDITGRILGICCIDRKCNKARVSFVVVHHEFMNVQWFSATAIAFSLAPARRTLGVLTAATALSPTELEPAADPVLSLMPLIKHHTPNDWYNT